MSERDLARQFRLQQWAAAIREQKASGMTIDQWCEAHSVGRHQYFYRQRAVRKAMAGMLEEKPAVGQTMPVASKSTLPIIEDSTPDVRFTPVPAEMLAPKPGAVMRIQRGGTMIELSNDVSDRILSFLREVILHAE